MKPTLIQVMLLSAFAIAVGDFAFRTWRPAIAPDYKIGGEVRPLSADTTSNARKHLYLRRSWRLTEAPESAWIQVLGHDLVEVFVNGRRVGSTPRVGQQRIGGVVADITPHVHVGQNTVAIHVLQLVHDRPPSVAVDGACELADEVTVSLESSAEWRVSDVYDRRGAFWYETDFSDEHWAQATVGAPVVWTSQVDAPPRAMTRRRRSQWITPAQSLDGAAALARTFDVPGTPRSAWLSVAATGPYRVAVNGWLIEDDRADLATKASDSMKERTFKISPFLRSGRNTVAVAVSEGGSVPRVRAELEATTRDGNHHYVGAGAEWKSASGSVFDWARPDLQDEIWTPSRPELGYQGVLPRAMQREFATFRAPLSFWIVRGFQYVAMILICAAAGGTGCFLVNWLATRLAPSDDARPPAATPYLALVTSAVAAAMGAIMTWDLRWTAYDVYQPGFLLALGLLVVAQWAFLLAMVAARRVPRFELSPSAIVFSHGMRRAAIVGCWIMVFGVAFWLRVRAIDDEPIHHDEVTAYMLTMSIFEQGFPGLQVHPDIPFGYVATSELAYYPNAIAALFVDDPRLVLRIPSVVWSMATLLLIGYVGWRWFNPYVGFVAAVLYALSPHAIGMANFGRYLAEVQFFTLLTMYFAYEAFRGYGPIRVKPLWCAALSFVAMYLSWEGSGIVGVGLAVAVLFHRRRHLGPVLSSPSLYFASTLVVIVVLAQNAHRIAQQSQRLWYGEGISSLTLKPMWRFPFFDVDYYLVNASWTRDALLPMAAVAAACFLAVKHRWRSPIRFALISLFVTAEIMSVFLPLRTNRYSYHLTQITILLAAAVAVAMAESLIKVARDARFPQLRWYARTVAAGSLVIWTAVASGWLVRASELKGFSTPAFDLAQLRFPDWNEPSQFVLDHLEEGDIIISILPHAQNFAMAAIQGDSSSRTVDYWLESRLILQATIGDTRDVPLDRRSGAIMLHDIGQLEQLLAEHDRIWYCTMRHGHSQINDGEVSRYLREHMDVAHESYATTVMLRDRNHRPATVRLEEQDAGLIASDFYLK